MLDLVFTSMAIVWGVAIVVFAVLEAATAGLTTIWFALGALAAFIAALCGAQLWLQIIWFFVISIVALIITRPLIKKYVNSKVTATNADRVVGMEGIVSEAIDNVAGTGAVTVDGKVWTARSDDGSLIPAGERVACLRIDGVKLIVSAAAEREE